MVTPKSDIKREVFSTRIDPDVLKKLKHLSVDLNQPLNSLIEEAISLLLKKHRKK